jgi:hypothetical protein
MRRKSKEKMIIYKRDKQIKNKNILKNLKASISSLLRRRFYVFWALSVHGCFPPISGLQLSFSSFPVVFTLCSFWTQSECIVPWLV